MAHFGRKSTTDYLANNLEVSPAIAVQRTKFDWANKGAEMGG
jgi:hypothetical protein